MNVMGKSSYTVCLHGAIDLFALKPTECVTLFAVELSNEAVSRHSEGQ